MSVEKFLNNPKTVEKVLTLLGEVQQLPEEGFLAGGAVSNLLLSMYQEHIGNTPKNFRVNDLDIFRVQKPGDDGYEKPEGEHMLHKDAHLGMDIFDDAYGHLYVERDGSYYKVISSKRDNKINNVVCCVSDGNYTAEDIQDNEFNFGAYGSEPKKRVKDVGDKDIILRGFDINCCQSGLDLETKKMFYTDEFKEFIKSKQILVTIPYTPLHTIIRLRRKLKLYDGYCYCNIHEEAKYLFQALSCPIETTEFFGVETYKKYMEDEEELSKYFTITTVEPIDMPHNYRKKYFLETLPNTIYSMLQAPVKELFNPDNEDRALWKFKFVDGLFERIEEDFNHLYDLKRIWELRHRTKKASHQRKIDLIFDNLNSIEPTTTVDRIYNSGKNHYRNNVPTYLCLLTNKEYYNCDFTEKHMDEINSFFLSHRRLIPLFTNIGTLQKHYEKTKMLKSLIRNTGEWVIGVLENLSTDVSDVDINEEYINELIEKEKERKCKPLCEAYDLSDFKYKDYVKELTSPLELMIEGDKMGHCVGGYSGSIENGRSRIFHIEIEGIGSTVEISCSINDRYHFGQTRYTADGTKSREPNRVPDNKKEFRIKQHYGAYPKMGNLRPPNKNRGIAFKLIYFLAKKYLSEEIFKENFEKGSSNGIYDSFTFEKKSSTHNKWSDWVRDGHSTYKARRSKKSVKQYKRDALWA